VQGGDEQGRGPIVAGLAAGVEGIEGEEPGMGEIPEKNARTVP